MPDSQATPTTMPNSPHLDITLAEIKEQTDKIPLIMERLRKVLETMAANQADLDSELTAVENDQATLEADVKTADTAVQAQITSLEAQIAAGAVDLQPELDRLKAIDAKEQSDDAAVKAATPAAPTS